MTLPIKNCIPLYLQKECTLHYLAQHVKKHDYTINIPKAALPIQHIILSYHIHTSQHITSPHFTITLLNKILLNPHTTKHKYLNISAPELHICWEYSIGKLNIKSDSLIISNPPELSPDFHTNLTYNNKRLFLPTPATDPTHYFSLIQISILISLN